MAIGSGKQPALRAQGAPIGYAADRQRQLITGGARAAAGSRGLGARHGLRVFVAAAFDWAVRVGY